MAKLTGTPFDKGWGTPPVAKDLTLRVACPGVPLRVHEAVAPLFEELIRRIDAVTHPGFMTSSGGYNFRPKRGMEKRYDKTRDMTLLSDHSWATAADFRAGENPGYKNKHCDFPRNTSDIAASVGLKWGGDWVDPFDPMHFYFDGTVAEAALWRARITKYNLLAAMKGADMTDDQFNTLNTKLDMILGQLGYADKEWKSITVSDGTSRRMSLVDMVKECHRELNQRINGNGRSRYVDTVFGHVLNLVKKEGL